MCIYCLLYYYSTKELITKDIIEHIHNVIESNSKICIFLLFNIFYSMHQSIEDSNSFNKAIYLPYFSVMFNNEFMSKSFYTDYEKIMNVFFK